MVAESGLSAVTPDLPEGIDLSIRSGTGKRVLILTNYAAEPRPITLPSAMQDVLKGGAVSNVTLPQFGVAILR